MIDHLIARSLSDGVLVFDKDNGATHLLAHDAWDLLVKFQDKGDHLEALSPDDRLILPQLKQAGLIG